MGTGPSSKNDILENLGISYSVWVELYDKERLKQILTDPAEFGNLLLEEVEAALLTPYRNSTLDDL